MKVRLKMEKTWSRTGPRESDSVIAPDLCPGGLAYSMSAKASRSNWTIGNAMAHLQYEIVIMSVFLSKEHTAPPVSISTGLILQSSKPEMCC